MLAGYPQILVHGQRSDADVNAVDVADDVQEKQIRRSSVLNLLDRPGFDRMSRCFSRGTHKFLERSSSPNLQQFNFVLLAVKTGDLLRLWSPAPALSSF